MQIAKWANGLAVAITVNAVNTLALKEGNDLEIYVEGERTLL